MPERVFTAAELRQALHADVQPREHVARAVLSVAGGGPRAGGFTVAGSALHRAFLPLSEARRGLERQVPHA